MSSKPRLTVLLAAGSTIALDPSQQDPPGMPSTSDLTNAVAKMGYPQIISQGTPFIFSQSGQKPFAIGHATSAVSLIHRALAGTFESVDFELILHAVEQLIPYASVRLGASAKVEFDPALGAFFEILRRYEVLNDWSLLRETRRKIVLTILEAIQRRSHNLPTSLPLHSLISTLASEFQLSLFTLNYDDVADLARSDWIDGFSGPAETSSQGRCWTARRFDARTFDEERISGQPMLVHLHGSVKFGPSRSGFGLVKYDSPQSAFDAIKDVSGSDQTHAGQIVSLPPIISGLNKAARLLLNPEPYGFYYRAFIDSILANERLLVIGYGARDPHINTWFDQYFARHEERRRVGWIGLLSGKMVGEQTPEKQMITKLSDNKFEDFRHCEDAGNSNRLFELDRLILGASGFPLPVPEQPKLISFLRG